MTLFRAAIFILALWAAIYLPGLGSPELKGEEGRRILPAEEMIDSGNWLVPHLAGEAYLRKPPLVNWAIAASFQLAGARNGWTARLPSVVAVLSVALALVWAGRAVLGVRGGMVAGAVFLTALGIMEKGRLAEIEAIYVACTALAFALWWGLRTRPGTRRWAWVAAGVFLGLGLLAKGPAHLAYFYLSAGAVVFGERRAAGGGTLRALRETLFETVSPWSIAGMAVWAGIFCAWMIPYFSALEGIDVAGVWKAQSVGRVTGQFDVGAWLLNAPRALMNLLPWVLFFPGIYRASRLGGAVGAELPPWFRPLALVSGCVYLVPMLVPGAVPRYVLPMAPVLSILFAAGIGRMPARPGEILRRIPWIGSGGNYSDAVFRASIAIGLAVAVSGALLPPMLKGREKVRPAGHKIEAAVGCEAGKIVVLDVGYQPALFYVRLPKVYLADENELESWEGAFVLTGRRTAKKIAAKFGGVEEIGEIDAPPDKPMVLMRVGPKKPRR